MSGAGTPVLIAQIEPIAVPSMQARQLPPPPAVLTSFSFLLLNHLLGMSDIKTRVVGAANTLEHRIYFGM